MSIRILLLALGLGVVAPALADTRHDLADPALAATVNGEPMSNAFVDLMQRIAQKGSADTPRAGVVQALVDDRLIAAYARQAGAGRPLIDDNKVGFSPDMQIRQAMVSNLQAGFRDKLEARLKQLKGGTLDGLILSEHVPTAAEWESVVGSQAGLRLEYTLDDKARTAAARVPLLRYRFDQEAPVTISLLEVYDAQNVQGRNQLHARGERFAREEARQLMKQRWILRWGQSAEGLGSTDFAVFRRAIEDRLVHTGWMAYLGVAADIHDQPQHLKDLQATVTPEEIRAYYDAHRDDFQRIDKVKARHLRVRDEATANALVARLHKGERFEALARENSLDADAATGGDLGWIVHGEQAHGWLDSLAFLQQPGVPSKPVRLPGPKGSEPGWEVLLVEDRVMGWQPPDSESVRYLASQAIARQKALDEYHGTLDRLRHEADIRLHPELSPLARPQEVR